MMLFYVPTVEQRCEMRTVIFFMFVLSLYYVFLKNSERGRD